MENRIFLFLLVLGASLFSFGCAPQFREVSKKSFLEDNIHKNEVNQLNYYLQSSSPLVMTKVSFDPKKEIIEGVVYEESTDTIFSVDSRTVGSLAYTYRYQDFDYFYVSFDERVNPIPFRIISAKNETEKVFVLYVAQKRIKTNTGFYPVVWIKDQNMDIVEGWVIKNYQPPYKLVYKKYKKKEELVIKARGNSVNGKKTKD